MVQLIGPVGQIPYRMALAGGWIDQPFLSRLNPEAPGSMVVVGLEPRCRFMDRAGMATSTRKIAHHLWNGALPERPPLELIRELYRAENAGSTKPSGSQDMAGLILPGISRLDYDYRHEGGVFPTYIESCADAEICSWLEHCMHVVPVAQRPIGYSPLGGENLDPQWIQRLGASGKSCFSAITAMSLERLGESLNECMRCWSAVLPHTVRHPLIATDLLELLSFYQDRYPGAMYSGCGGGYLFVVSAEAVPGAFQVHVRRRSA